MKLQDDETILTLRKQNDEFRHHLNHLRLSGKTRLAVSNGNIVFSDGVRQLGASQGFEIIKRIVMFDEFIDDEHNGVLDEHNFGAFVFDDRTFIWEIQYRDRSLRYPSPNPANPGITARVLLIKLDSES